MEALFFMEQRGYNQTGYGFSIRAEAKKHGVSYATLARRLKRGMTLEEAVKQGSIRRYEYEGKLWELSELARHVGIKAPTLSDRIHLQGMDIKAAVATPVKIKAEVATTTKTPGYQVWIGMKNRCYNSKHKSYKDYGARGIVVCDRWRESCENFLEDMGQPPTGLSLGRIDNNGPYSPENCQWETPIEQASNKRTSRLVTAFGKTQTLAKWAKESGLYQGTISVRLDYHGYTPEEALSLPSRKTGKGGILKIRTEE